MNRPELGFIGLGRMGGPMAGRLVAAGYSTMAYDAAGTAERLPAGASGAASVAGVAAGTDVILLSLPDGAASQSVCQEIVDARNRRAVVVVDLSTIGIAIARDCGELLRQSGLTYVDAPVSGGVAGASSGTLSMMVGADPRVFAELLPLLGVIASNCFLVGPDAGQGQAMKLVNNYIAATALAATSEAVVFGAAFGLDLAQMIEVINVSSGRTTASTDKFPRSVIPRTYGFGFAASLMAKDVGLYLDSADEADTPRSVADSVADLWRRFDAACSGADFTLIHRYLEDGGL